MGQTSRLRDSCPSVNLSTHTSVSVLHWATNPCFAMFSFRYSHSSTLDLRNHYAINRSSTRWLPGLSLDKRRDVCLSTNCHSATERLSLTVPVVNFTTGNARNKLNSGFWRMKTECAHCAITGNSGGMSGHSWEIGLCASRRECLTVIGCTSHCTNKQLVARVLCAQVKCAQRMARSHSSRGVFVLVFLLQLSSCYMLFCC